MLEFYNVIKEVNPNQQNIAMTVLDGECSGEKALLSDSRLVWESAQDGFYTKHKDELRNFEKTGIKIIGGQRVFCDLLGNEKKMVICGGGHVSIPVIRIGLMIGFKVIVLDDRPKFADNARRAGATEVICEPFEQALKNIQGDEDTFFVIVTRGHRYDHICLENIAKKKHAYIGMIGSRKRVAKVKEAILGNGGDAEVLNRVYTPIGLNIGAETPEEIAVSIMAEIIEVKNKSLRNGGYSKEIMQGILKEENEQEPKVLATIVKRKGPAPREVGAKMLIMEDGTCVGTIGGGCAEADIFREARFMLMEGGTNIGLCHVDMTGRYAEEDGMVCGGIIDVLLEVI